MKNIDTNTILLVEDEAIIAMNQEQTLKKHGYNVVKAFSGEKALEKISADTSIFLILMDIDLGKGMDGTETASEILKENDVPIVFLTSHSEKEYVEKVKKITKYGYVLKNSGEFVLIESIHMARELYSANKKLIIKQQESSSSEKKFREIFNNLDIAVQGYYKDGTVHYWNKASQALYGYTKEEALKSNLFDLLISEEMTDDIREAVKEMFTSEKVTPSEELILKRKNGTNIPVYSNHTMIKISENLKELYCIDIDLTQIKEYEKQLKKNLEEKNIILKELRHRVKNSFMLITSMIHLMASPEKTKTELTLLSDLDLKISAIAELYNLLYSSNSIESVQLDEYLKSLIDNFRLSSDNVDFITNTTHLTVSARNAIPIGIIISELITNSIKHAFMEQCGTIRIVLKKTEKGGFLHYSDNGRGLDEGFDLKQTDKLGMNLIKGLSEQIDGKFNVEITDGFSCTLDFSTI